MKPLKLGENFTLPAQICTKTVAILGLRGAGKSNTATVLVEEMLDQNLPPVIIDPTDAWWGLRSKYPVVIFGGAHGDVPLQETDGKVVAEFIVAEKVPVVLSLRHFRKNAQKRFVTDFCEELYHIKGRDENRTSLTVVIDEAPLFVPQKVQGENARMVGAVEDLIARGRSSGFGVVLISQRSATINKDVLTQSDVIITHRLTSPQDKKALGEWFEDNATSDKQKEILASLAQLPDGCAWVWAPTLKVMDQVQMRRRATFDSSATPELGKAIVAPKRLTEVNLEVLKDRMKATIERAKAEDPKTLKAEIARLKIDLAKKPAASAAERIEVPAMSHAETQMIRAGIVAIGTLDTHLAQFSALVSEMKQDFSNLAGKLATLGRPILRQPAATPHSKPTPKVERHIENTGALSGGQRKILTVLAQYPSGKRTVALAHLAGFTVNGHFNNMMGGLRSFGLVSPANQQPIQITQEGMAALGSYEPLPTGEALREQWLQKVGGSEARILRVLIERYPQGIRTADLAEAAGYTVNGHFNNMMGHLRSIELAVGYGEVKANDSLFE